MELKRLRIHLSRQRDSNAARGIELALELHLDRTQQIRHDYTGSSHPAEDFLRSDKAVTRLTTVVADVALLVVES